MAIRSKQRRFGRERKFIMNEFNYRKKIFLDDIIPIFEKYQKRKNWMYDFFYEHNHLNRILLEHDEKWCRYVDNKKKDPKYHVAPKDNDMFLKHANYLMVRMFLNLTGVPESEIIYLYPKQETEQDFITEIHNSLCDRYQKREQKKYNITEIQRKTFFYVTLNWADWCVSFLRQR